MRVIAALAMCLALTPMALADDRAALEKRGEALVSRHCAMCHAIGRSGASPHPEAPQFRQLSRRYPVRALEEALGEGIMSGHPAMPEFRFEADDVGAIIAWLEAIQER